MYDKYTYVTGITHSNDILPKHKAVMLINDINSHKHNPNNNSFLIKNNSGNTAFWNPTAPSNAVAPFTIIPIEIYSHPNAIDSSVSVYLLN
jgi:hypothetical protein